MAAPPFVSVIIPCRNEELFIDRCLTSLRSGDFPRDRMEVLVVDGMSDDRTREIVERRAAGDPGIALVENPGRIAPTALNIGIRRAKGEIIVRIDAHAVYGRDYVSKLVDWLTRSGADNVGGVWLTRPANATPRARAIAIGLAHPFGVGNAHFRIGTSEPRWVDTVPFGCYRREVFDRIGLFDEDLVRDQDDEFNARLIRSGGRILLVPEIVSEYFARESIVKLWRTYFQYGYFKPLAARKLGAIMTIRQLIPALFVTAVIVGGALASLFAPLRAPFAAGLGTYVAADLACAASAGRGQGTRCALWLAVVFPVLHLAYGLGFLKGIADFVARDQRTNRRAIAPTR